MGNSQPWAQIVETLTDQSELKPDAILEFFQPLYIWLKKGKPRSGLPGGLDVDFRRVYTVFY